MVEVQRGTLDPGLLLGSGGEHLDLELEEEGRRKEEAGRLT